MHANRKHLSRAFISCANWKLMSPPTPVNHASQSTILSADRPKRSDHSALGCGVPKFPSRQSHLIDLLSHLMATFLLCTIFLSLWFHGVASWRRRPWSYSSHSQVNDTTAYNTGKTDSLCHQEQVSSSHWFFPIPLPIFRWLLCLGGLVTLQIRARQTGPIHKLVSLETLNMKHSLSSFLELFFYQRNLLYRLSLHCCRLKCHLGLVRPQSIQ